LPGAVRRERSSDSCWPAPASRCWSSKKHAYFLRDFRGDTVHPSTLEILDVLGLADRFLTELPPHTEVRRLVMRLPTRAQLGIDFRRLPTRFPFLAFVPQWDFLRFVTSEAVRYTGFTLVTQAEVEDLIVDNDQVGGVRYCTPAGLQEVRALLTVGADGRTTTMWSGFACHPATSSR
jgi:2-polyprenyl-6-methoxyphenol hydroxylase-like FAD-dependent oxidoreductase